MRKIELLALAAMCLSAPAFAQTHPTTPGLTGGVPNPITGVPNPISPFGVDPLRGETATPQRGGYTVFSPRGITRVVPNPDGGYTVFGPNGITRVMRNSDGGYTVFGNGSYDRPCFAPGYGWYPCPVLSH
jgi:hypothetical protein